MSEAFHIISDGSCDLPMELTKEKDITVVPFYVSFEEGKYQKEMIEIGVREFYQEMVDHPDVYPKSSMPSVQDYVDAFLPFVKAGTPIICICIHAVCSECKSDPGRGISQCTDLCLRLYCEYRIAGHLCIGSGTP